MHTPTANLLLHGPSATAVAITSLAVLVLAFGVARALCISAKNGHLTMNIGRPSQHPTRALTDSETAEFDVWEATA